MTMMKQLDNLRPVKTNPYDIARGDIVYKYMTGSVPGNVLSIVG
jgi:hypothetical protein